MMTKSLSQITEKCGLEIQLPSVERRFAQSSLIFYIIKNMRVFWTMLQVTQIYVLLTQNTLYILKISSPFKHRVSPDST